MIPGEAFEDPSTDPPGTQGALVGLAREAQRFDLPDAHQPQVADMANDAEVPSGQVPAQTGQTPLPKAPGIHRPPPQH